MYSWPIGINIRVHSGKSKNTRAKKEQVFSHTNSTRDSIPNPTSSNKHPLLSPPSILLTPKRCTYTPRQALRRKQLETFRIHGHSRRNRLRVHFKGRQVQIRNRITGLMVVDIRRDPRLAPEHRRLLRLDLFGASEVAPARMLLSMKAW